MTLVICLGVLVGVYDIDAPFDWDAGALETLPIHQGRANSNAYGRPRPPHQPPNTFG